MLSRFRDYNFARGHSEPRQHGQLQLPSRRSPCVERLLQRFDYFRMVFRQISRFLLVDFGL